MEALKTVVVTGSNKGVGYGIVENLVQKNFKIIMACRNVQLANQARQQLIEQYKVAEDKLHTIELDVSQSKSIDKFLEEFGQRFKSADILVNNAGMAFKGDEFDAQIVATTFQTNFYGTVELTEKFIPFLNPKGKIVTIGSFTGSTQYLTSQALKDRFRKEDLTRDELFGLAKEFHDDVARGDYLEKGWPKWGYAMSKLCINMFARVLAGYPSVVEKRLQVYSVCPGWVKTDMAGDEAELTIQEGAITPVFAVELPHEIQLDYQGKFISKCKVAQL